MAKRLQKRAAVHGERIRQATKDERIESLQIAYENAERLRQDGNLAYNRQAEELSLVKRMRDSLGQQLEAAKAEIVDLKVENGRMLGYIQRAQEDDMVRSPLISDGTVTNNNNGQVEHINHLSRFARTPTVFGDGRPF